MQTIMCAQPVNCDSQTEVLQPTLFTGWVTMLLEVLEVSPSPSPFYRTLPASEWTPEASVSRSQFLAAASKYQKWQMEASKGHSECCGVQCSYCRGRKVFQRLKWGFWNDSYVLQNHVLGRETHQLVTIPKLWEAENKGMEITRETRK